MSTRGARSVAVCLRAAAPPAERDADAGDAARGLVQDRAAAVARLLERIADVGGAGSDLCLTLVLAPPVTAALPSKVAAALRAAEARGALELGTTTATDAWLPALGRAGRRAQLAAACAEHAARFGRRPLGLWPRELALPDGADAIMASLGLAWALVPWRALLLGRPRMGSMTPAHTAAGVALFAVSAPKVSGADDLATTVDGRPPLTTIAAEIDAQDQALEHAAALRATYVTPSRYLARHPRGPLVWPAPLCCADERGPVPYAGEDGAKMLRHLRQVEAALTRASAAAAAAAAALRRGGASRFGEGRTGSGLLRRRLLLQAAREGLLAAAADWCQLGEYGAARFRAHVARCLALLTALERAAPDDALLLGEVEARDGALFEDLEAASFAPRAPRRG
jgi:predicted glycosyl hydrolase (DUF1957 family)